MFRSISHQLRNSTFFKSEGNISLWILSGILLVGLVALSVMVFNKINSQISKEDQSSIIPSTTPQALILTKEIQTLNINATNSSVVKVKSEQELCKDSGGVWTRGPLSGEEFCNERMPDAGKSCSDYSECQSGACLSKEPSGPGQCGEFKANFGCYYRYYKGIISPVQLCGD